MPSASAGTAPLTVHHPALCPRTPRPVPVPPRLSAVISITGRTHFTNASPAAPAPQRSGPQPPPRPPPAPHPPGHQSTPRTQPATHPTAFHRVPCQIRRTHYVLALSTAATPQPSQPPCPASPPATQAPLALSALPSLPALPTISSARPTHQSRPAPHKPSPPEPPKPPPRHLLPPLPTPTPLDHCRTHNVH